MRQIFIFLSFFLLLSPRNKRRTNISPARTTTLLTNRMKNSATSIQVCELQNSIIHTFVVHFFPQLIGFCKFSIAGNKQAICKPQQLTAIGNRLLDWFSVIMADSKKRRQHPQKSKSKNTNNLWFITAEHWTFEQFLFYDENDVVISVHQSYQCWNKASWWKYHSLQHSSMNIRR